MSCPECLYYIPDPDVTNRFSCGDCGQNFALQRGYHNWHWVFVDRDGKLDPMYGEELMNSLFKAALSHYEARRQEARAVLEIYFGKSVGIGEHSDLMAEVTKWTEILANAEDCYESLKRNFNSTGTPKLDKEA